MMLYTAVYSHIQLKLWTSKSGFLYTDNLDETFLVHINRTLLSTDTLRKHYVPLLNISLITDPPYFGPYYLPLLNVLMISDPPRVRPEGVFKNQDQRPASPKHTSRSCYRTQSRNWKLYFWLEFTGMNFPKNVIYSFF